MAWHSMTQRGTVRQTRRLVSSRSSNARSASITECTMAFQRTTYRFTVPEPRARRFIHYDACGTVFYPFSFLFLFFSSLSFFLNCFKRYFTPVHSLRMFICTYVCRMYESMCMYRARCLYRVIQNLFIIIWKLSFGSSPPISFSFLS